MHSRYTIDSDGLEADRIALFGKIPARGDFVSVGLSRATETEMLKWLQSGLQESESAFGNEWHRIFHATPPWRFVVERTLWDEATMVGVLMPSMDRVKRSFPLVLTAKIRNYNGHPRMFCYDSDWFGAAEALAASSSARDFDIDNLMGGVRRLRLPYARPTPEHEPRYDHRVSLWWTVDRTTRRLAGFKTSGAPTAKDFLRIIRGETAAVAKPVQGAQVRAPDRTITQSQAAKTVNLNIDRGYATHAGTRLSQNADALLVSENPRLFVIADGIGDSSSAVNAAKITTNTLAYTSPCPTIDMLIKDVKGKLGRAHGLVQSAHQALSHEPPSASVVALVTLGDALAVIWAGDARCYLLRDGMMRCLTRDHVEVGIRFVLSRSVGAQGPLVPEVVVDTARPGDRLLLCSAALTRALDERSIADVVFGRPAKEAAETLIQDALIANVRENVSAIVVGLGTT